MRRIQLIYFKDNIICLTPGGGVCKYQLFSRALLFKLSLEQLTLVHERHVMMTFMVTESSTLVEINN